MWHFAAVHISDAVWALNLYSGIYIKKKEKKSDDMDRYAGQYTGPY